MNSVRNLSEVLSSVRTSGAGITFCEAGTERFLSYDGLYENATALLGELQGRGVQAKQFAVLQTEDNERFVTSFWACVLGGIIPVPLTAGRTDEGRRKLLSVCKQLGEPYLLCEADIWESIQSYGAKMDEGSVIAGLQSKLLPFEDLFAAKQGPAGKPQPAGWDDTAFLQFTSGSTGDPKGVVLTHGNLISNMRAIVNGAKSTDRDSSLSWLPLTHDMGLIGFHLTPILGGMNQWQMPTSMFVLHPMRWMEIAHKHRITCLASPNFGYVHFLQHFKAEAASHWDLSSIRLIFNGAEPISASHCRDFLARMREFGLREECIFPVYGLAEASLAVTFPGVEEHLGSSYVNRKSLAIGDTAQLADASDPDGVEIVELGFPVEECAVRIGNEAGGEQAEGQIGLIFIKGSNVTKGYFNRPDVNAEVITRDGWLNTGDLGFMRGGRLFVTGRMKDIIFANGQNVYPHDLEALMSEIKGAEIGKTAVCAVQDDVSKQDEIAVFIQHRGKVGAFIELKRSVQRLLNKRTGLQIKLVVPVKRIPKTTSGKIQRYALAESMNSGEFAAVLAELAALEAAELAVRSEANSSGEETLTQTERILLDIWRDLLKSETMGVDDHFLEHGGNSLLAAYAAARLEQALGLDIALGELFQYPTARLLAAFLDGKEVGGNAQDNRTLVAKAQEREYYPATAAQKRLFMLEEIHPGLLSYHLPYAIDIKGALDGIAFWNAWQRLVRRHASLRTSFTMKEGQVLQRIEAELEPPISQRDGRAWTAAETKAKIKSFLRPYKLDEGPLFRIELIMLSQNHHLMLFDMHHLITDGTSMGVLISEFLHLYEGGSLPPIDLHVGDIAMWEETARGDKRAEEQRAFWRRRFAGGVPAFEWPSDYARPLRSSHQGSVETFLLDAELAANLNRLAASSGGTLYTVLLSIYYALLSKYTGAEDMIVGTAAAGRTQLAVRNMVGLFVNMLPIRLTGGKELTVNEWLKKAGGDIMETLGHQDISFDEVVELSGAAREAGRHPLFDTVFTLQNMDIPDFKTSGAVFKSSLIPTGTAKFDMTWECTASDAGITFSIEYAEDLFRADSVKQLARHYAALAKAFVQRPEASLLELSLLDAEEKAHMAELSASPRAEEYAPLPLHERFRLIAERHPERVALEMNGKAMTYRELEEGSNALASWLRDRGVAPKSRVALMLRRSFSIPLAILAVLKTGAAYVPIDPTYPEERISFMLEDGAAGMLLTGAADAAKSRELAAKSLSNVQVYDLDERREEWMGADPSEFKAEVTNADLAYIMYTSGSTGKPKGILTTHRNVSRIAVEADYIRLSENDVLLQLSNYAFDGSTFDLYGALLNGAKLVLASEEDVLDAGALLQRIKDQEVTVFFTTTALFNVLVDNGLHLLSHIRHVLFGGERASAAHVKKALRAFGPGVLLHVYGPTETTVFATCYPVRERKEDSATIPIGRPIALSDALVLDERGEWLPPLMTGELCIAGEGVAQGYLNLPDMTAEKFVPHPFKEGEYMYRTGDLVRWLPDGQLEFLDRIDSQVKLRGFRIELGEIESRLLECAGVRETVVVVRERDGQSVLTAYAVVDTEEWSIERLRAELGEKLPGFMMPAAFVRMDKLPLTANGKVDKKKLPEPEAADFGAGRGGAFEAPASRTESKLKAVWQAVLHPGEIGVCDHFFDHGGHSLKAATLAAEIQKQFQVRMPIKDIFLHPTIREQAAWIDQAESEILDSIVPAAEQSSYPLSPAQQRIFLIEQMGGAGIAYHIPLALRVDSSIDRKRIERALQQLIARHESLRTSFHLHAGEARQTIHSDVAFALKEADGTGGKGEKFSSFVKPLKLSQAPLLDAAWLDDGVNDHYLFLNVHHIAADGLSMALLIEELEKLLTGEPLPEVKVQYKDYAVWRERQNESERMLAHGRYWREALAAPLPALDMTLDYARGERQTFEGETVPFSVPGRLGQSLQKLADESGISLSSLLFASYGLLLQKHTGQRELVVGALTAGRTHPDAAETVGMFNGFLPIRLHVPEGTSFAEYAKATHDRLLDAYEHQEAAFETIVEAAQLPFDPSRNAMFDTMLIVHNQLENGLQLEGEGRLLQLERLGEGTTAKLDFKLDLYPSGEGGFAAELEFSTRLFRRSTMERFAERWLSLLEQAAISFEEDSALYELASPKDKKLILSQWNGTEFDYPQGETIHGMFAKQAAKTPQAIAVRTSGGELTYKELDDRSNGLAKLLIEKGIGADTVVPIVTQRSLGMMIGIMAILKAGGAYLPIDPTFPTDRIRYILEDSGAALLISERKWLAGLPFSGEAFELETAIEAVYGMTGVDLEPPAPTTGSRNMAYVIYTSGSTGRPKGVMVEHDAVINRLNWMQHDYPIGEGDVILQKTPITFDVSVWELFWWSFEGASLYLLEPGGEKEPGLILRAIQEQGVSVMHFVPSMLGVFLPYAKEASRTNPFHGLKYVFTSGEALKPAHVVEFYRQRGEAAARLVNLYGPTEATVDVSAYDCEGYKEGSVPIGAPIHNIRLYVVNENRELQPVGVPGELCIAGVGLARGYLGQADLTAEKFVADPFYPGERMYLTGDRARWLEDGNIEYLGRFDFQVKIRGLRIECGEIEHALLALPSVTDAIVTAVKDRLGEYSLCAYVASSGFADEGAVKEALKLSLPDYMIPSWFVFMDALPLNASGKTDRASLPLPNFPESGQGGALSTETEEKLAELWAGVLGTELPGADDHFFQIGGHSLRAAQLAGLAEQRFGVAFAMRDVFAHPVLREMASAIERAAKKESIVLKPADIRPHYPLSLAQNRLFVLHEMNAGGTVYNLPLALRIDGELKVERLQHALQALVDRHEPLRTSFHWRDGSPVQVIEENVALTAEVRMVPKVDAAAEEMASFVQPFDLRQAPLIRASLVTDGAEGHLLLMDMHHIVSDGISMTVLASDFADLYAGEQLAPLSIHYKDVAVWQREWMQGKEREEQENYWKSALAGSLPVLELPSDRPRPLEQSFKGAKLRRSLPAPLLAGVEALAVKTGLTPYHVLLAGYHLLLHKLTGQEDIIVGTPIGGRFHPETEPLVGMFVGTAAIRGYVHGGLTFLQFAESVKSTVVDALDHGMLPFEHIVTALETRRDLSRNPIFDTMFVLQNMDAPALEAAGLRFEPKPLPHAVAKLDLTFELAQRGRDLQLTAEYATALFDEATVSRYVDFYFRILETVTADEHLLLGDVSLLSREEEGQLVSAFNDTAAPYAAHRTVEDYLEAQAKWIPHEAALVWDGGQMTYGELDAASNRLARTLRGRGTAREAAVAVMIDRSPEMMIAIFGVLKAGAAYVPVSPSLPAERVRYMLEDSGAELILTKGETAPHLLGAAKVLRVEDALLNEPDGSALEKIHDARSLAYILYTSGSTGQPKGVMIEHHSVVNRIGWMQREYPLDIGDVILQKTPITFDVSVWELFWWSFVGARLCLLVPGGEKDPDALVSAIAEHGVTTMHFVPSMLHLFLSHSGVASAGGKLASLNTVFASGEALTPDMAIKFKAVIGGPHEAKLINLYGPTEATVDVSYFDCSEPEGLSSIPIGKPIDNISLYIMSDAMKLQPVGVAGELCIGGVGLARGYWKRPDLTAEKFVPNPYAAHGHETLYRTGDLARMLPDGNIDYLGRIDHQVKIRGYRIECGEIEQALMRHAGIKEAVVMKREGDAGGEGAYLCAYIVAVEPVTSSVLREFLTLTLPDYMVPAVYVEVPHIPLSPSGKADRKALPAPERRLDTGVSYEAANGETEQAVSAVWAELLGRDDIGVHHNFFDVGGESLLLIRAHQRLEEQYPGVLSVTDLFNYPTIARLAAYIDSRADSGRVWTWSGVTLPRDPSPKTYVAERKASYQLAMDAELSKGLRDMAASLSAPAYTAPLALFALFWKQQSGAASIELPLARPNGRLAALAVDFGAVKGFDELLVQAGHAIAQSDQEYDWRKVELNRSRSEDGTFTVAPLFADASSGSPGAGEEWLDLFDLVLTVRTGGAEENFEMTGVMEFNARKLGKDRVKEWAQSYLKLLRMAVEQYRLAAKAGSGGA
ncbi:amino acid adenylation domain-containing protein [Paenibacillus sp. GCM10027627]|uniref:amino acid adenylation domain-containing protein n=1 Tax=unclassified Paenibacillus TaxID=185978 RepID=UPI00363AA724